MDLIFPSAFGSSQNRKISLCIEILGPDEDREGASSPFSIQRHPPTAYPASFLILTLVGSLATLILDAAPSKTMGLSALSIVVAVLPLFFFLLIIITGFLCCFGCCG
jgi:hypothetical protein